jgi:hypothetical protein
MLRSRGGSGSINPRTGLPEFFSLKGAFKKIGSAVKKFASSTVGKIVIGAALFMVAGPAAAAMLGVSAPAAVSAVSGFVAGAGGNLLAGGNLKDSLKIGAKGALTAGALTGVTQGASAFKGVPKPSAGATTFPATDTGAGITRTPVEGAATATSPAISTAEGIMRSPIAAATSTVPSGTVNLGNLGGNMPSAAGFSPSAQTSLQQGAGTAATTGATPSPGFFGNIKAAINPNDDVGIMQGLNRAFNPNQIEAAARAAGNPDPSMFAKYAPIAGAALGIGALAGGFDAEQPEVPAGFEDMAAGRSPGQKLLTDKPEQYGLQFGGVNTTYAPNPYTFMFAPPPPAPITRRDGGIAELRGYRAGGDPSQFPRKNGHINGAQAHRTTYRRCSVTASSCLRQRPFAHSATDHGARAQNECSH